MVTSCSAIFTALSLSERSTLSAHAYIIKSVPAQRAVLYRTPMSDEHAHW
jgi:methionine-rich copper-binding protein CopC